MANKKNKKREGQKRRTAKRHRSELRKKGSRQRERINRYNSRDKTGEPTWWQIGIAKEAKKLQEIMEEGKDG